MLWLALRRIIAAGRRGGGVSPLNEGDEKEKGKGWMVDAGV